MGRRSACKPLVGGFWLWLCRFAYRRIGLREGKRPMGVPAHRDPEFPCETYAPRSPHRRGEWKDCLGDGHFLCEECAHKGPTETAEY